MIEADQPKGLRIVLDGGATGAYEAMVKRMRELTSTIKVQPSHFVSFLLTDYLEAHFEKDINVLVAEFFDSDGFYEAERKLAKGKPNYEELMQEALDKARQIKARRRSRSVPKKPKAPTEPNV